MDVIEKQIILINEVMGRIENTKNLSIHSF